MVSDMRSLRKLVLLSAAAALAGCGPEANNQAKAPAGNDAGPALAAQPVKAEHRSLALTPQWLAGRWQTDDADCSAGDTFLSFGPDGSYSFMQEAGRWSLQGNALTIEITAPAPDGGSKAGDRIVAQVKPVGPNEAELQPADGQAPSRIYRCHIG